MTRRSEALAGRVDPGRPGWPGRSWWLVRFVPHLAVDSGQVVTPGWHRRRVLAAATVAAATGANTGVQPAAVATGVRCAPAVGAMTSPNTDGAGKTSAGLAHLRVNRPESFAQPEAVAKAGFAAGHRGRSRSRCRQAGMVSIELAFGSLGAALAVVAIAWTLALVALLVRCQDTAAEVARQQARADHSAVAKAVKDRPLGAKVVIDQDGEQVRVKVNLRAQPWASWLPSVPLQASAVVLREPG